MSADKKKSKGLGKGLAALLGDEGIAALRDETPTTPAAAPAPSSAAPEKDAAALPARGGALRLPIGDLMPNPDQPRRHFDDAALAELADSIGRHGLIQPILVRPNPKGPAPYEIVAGERRWRAAQIARLHDVPVVVRAFSDEDTLAVALIENIQRQDLNPVEEAEGYARLMERFGHTQEAVAALVGKSRPAVANALRLLGLSPPILAQLRAGQITAGHARALLGINRKDGEVLAREVIARGLSVREVEARIKSFLRDDIAVVKPSSRGSNDAANKSGAKKAGAPVPKDANIRAFERGLSDALGLAVSVEPDQAREEAGRLIIYYEDLEQLEDIERRLKRG